MITTILYERIFVKGDVVQRWPNEIAQVDWQEADTYIENLNRIAMMQYNLHPENGLWIYVQKGKI